MKNKIELVEIVTAQTMWEKHVSEKSLYDISKHKASFIYENQEWTYHNSGLAREVYKSKCGKFVIKIPLCSLISEKELQIFLDKNLRYAPLSIHHNYYEAIAYKECPDEYKKYLAKTELLSNCWVKQEFVEVKSTVFRHDLREIGKRENGEYCIFDYDPLLRDFKFERFDWKRLTYLIENAIKNIK